MTGRRHGDPDATVGRWRDGRLGHKSQADIEADRRAELRVAALGDDPNELAGPLEVRGDITVADGVLRVAYVPLAMLSGFVVAPPFDETVGDYNAFRFWLDQSVNGDIPTFDILDGGGFPIFAVRAPVSGLDTRELIFVDAKFRGYASSESPANLRFELDTATGFATLASIAVTTLNTAGSSSLGDSQSDLTTIFGKRTTAGNAPGVVIGAAAGTGASVGAFATGSNDISGRVTLNTGTSPGTGTLCTVTFNTAYPATPKNISANQASATGGVVDLYTTSITASTFVIGCNDAPAASSTITVGWEVD